MTGRKEEDNTDYLEIPFKVSTSCPSFVGLRLANKHCMCLRLQVDQGEKSSRATCRALFRDIHRKGALGLGSEPATPRVNSRFSGCEKCLGRAWHGVGRCKGVSQMCQVTESIWTFGQQKQLGRRPWARN